MKAGIIVFPGTNCDLDTERASKFFGWETRFIWHDETNLDDCDIVFIPGGFSYGDYIRAGGLAKFSPAVLSLKKYADDKRGFIFGICNGFQILCETGLLPGALSVNYNTRFICDDVPLESSENWLPRYISLPIAHGEGNYILPDEVIKGMSKDFKLEDLMFLKYRENPNGSFKDIAGLYDKKRKILGMMPHPERAVFEETAGNTKSTDGRYFFEMIEAELK